MPEILEKTSAPLDDLNETKALVLGQRTGLLDAIAVADTGGLVLIVILHARIGAHDFAVQRVAVKVVPASDIDTWEEAQSHEFGIAEGAASWVGARQPVAVVAHAIFTERLARAIPKYPHLGDVLSEDVHDPISVPHYSWGCVSIVGNCPPLLRVTLRSLSIERFDRVRGVEHPPCRRRELQKQYQPVPSITPDFHRLRVFTTQFTGLKSIQPGTGRVLICSCVDIA